MLDRTPEATLRFVYIIEFCSPVFLNTVCSSGALFFEGSIAGWQSCGCISEAHDTVPLSSYSSGSRLRAVVLSASLLCSIRLMTNGPYRSITFCSSLLPPSVEGSTIGACLLLAVWALGRCYLTDPVSPLMMVIVLYTNHLQGSDTAEASIELLPWCILVHHAGAGDQKASTSDLIISNCKT